MSQIEEPTIDDLIDNLEQLRIQGGVTPNWSQRKKIREARILLREEERRQNKMKTVWVFGPYDAKKPPGWDRTQRPACTFQDRLFIHRDVKFAQPLPWQGNSFVDPITREKSGTIAPKNRDEYVKAPNGQLYFVG
jgi:hypothetical protein